MQRKQLCPEYGKDARRIGLTIEGEDWARNSYIVETTTYFCSACDKTWDVRIRQAERVHLGQSLVAIHG